MHKRLHNISVGILLHRLLLGLVILAMPFFFAPRAGWMAISQGYSDLPLSLTLLAKTKTLGTMHNIIPIALACFRLLLGFIILAMPFWCAHLYAWIAIPRGYDGIRNEDLLEEDRQNFDMYLASTYQLLRPSELTKDAWER